MMRCLTAAPWLTSLALTTPCAAIEGRWEGHTTLAGQSQPVVLDLAGPQPIALVTLPGRSVQRLRLAGFVRGEDGRWQGRATPAPGGTEADALQLTLQAQGPQLIGHLRLGGHVAALHLQRTGEAMTPPPPLQPLPAVVLGVWRGRYDLGLGGRELTLRLAEAGSTLSIVGRRQLELALDDAGRRGALLMLRADAADLQIQAPWAAAGEGVLHATLRQGAFEVAVEFRREGSR